VVVPFAVGHQQAMREVDETVDVADVAHRRPWRKPTQETDFGLEDVAGTGQVALVEQRFAN